MLFGTIREDLRVVRERDPAARSTLEALLAAHLPAIWLHRPAHRLYLRGLRVPARLVTLIGRRCSGGVDIHPGARIGRRLFVDHGCSVVIGEQAVLGDDVTIFQQVTIGAVGWWRDNRLPVGERRHPIIGDRVVIGAGATILGRIEVGDDCVIGAHALVLTDVPPKSVVRAPASVTTARTRI
ncbi:serine O-acetyltransferase EpsC [Actinacidiphila bryophytorum]|uniref:Serine acetyltransferase n=1 Tax=Actinacidiphila bryophytorum TaxID=1436133 RepID=A0A9W4H229_9ACTN|nr:serine O-acetyltransferase EpsC [Actinacidiphila bryophytorum]CAG7644940.1 Serine acetyltransferase [Actinacidiphila bryophytorum]